MKICAIICEYNPFHNGHLYQIQEAKKRSCADAVLCLMSGDFVQRGEEAILDKYTRAKHAVLAGADVVIQLPTLFSTSCAEIFAQGAVSILSSIPAVTHLCFGVEKTDEQTLLKQAQLLLTQSKPLSKAVKKYVKQGFSYIKAREQAYQELFGQALPVAPNDILALEYVKAILAQKSAIIPLPVQRVGSGYADTKIQGNFSSATALRLALQNQTLALLSDNVPDFVYPDLINACDCHAQLETMQRYAVLANDKKRLALVTGCSEGLENAFLRTVKDCAPFTQLTSARYTTARIRRIALQNLLGIDEQLIKKCLHAPLYLRLLAVKKNHDALLSCLAQSTLPLLIRIHDEETLKKWAKRCYQKDIFAEKVFDILHGKQQKKHIFL